jgi:hypothetical protein
MLIFLGFLMNAQNKKVVSTNASVQNEDEITVLKKNVNNVSAKVNNLQNKINYVSSEEKKKIDAFSEEIKGMKDKVDKTYALSNDIKTDFDSEKRFSTERFNSTAHSLSKLKYFTLIVSFLLAILIVVVAYYLNSTLKKNVSNINGSMNDVIKNVNKQVDEMKAGLDKQLNEFRLSVEKKIVETSDELQVNLTKAKDSFEGKIFENKSGIDKNINGIKESFGNQLNDTKENLNSFIIKNDNETKAIIEKQMAVFKNEIFKEISDVKTKVQNLNRNS